MIMIINQIIILIQDFMKKLIQSRIVTQQQEIGYLLKLLNFEDFIDNRNNFFIFKIG